MASKAQRPSRRHSNREPVVLRREFATVNFLFAILVSLERVYQTSDSPFPLQGDAKYNKRFPHVLGQENCVVSWHGWGAACCPCTCKFCFRRMMHHTRNSYTLSAARVGNMSVLLETREADGRRKLWLVAGPYWPMMLFISLPSILGLSLIVSESGLLQQGQTNNFCCLHCSSNFVFVLTGLDIFDHQHSPTRMLSKRATVQRCYSGFSRRPQSSFCLLLD